MFSHTPRIWSYTHWAIWESAPSSIWPSMACLERRQNHCFISFFHALISFHEWHPFGLSLTASNRFKILSLLICDHVYTYILFSAKKLILNVFPQSCLKEQSRYPSLDLSLNNLMSGANSSKSWLLNRIPFIMALWKSTEKHNKNRPRQPQQAWLSG